MSGVASNNLPIATIIDDVLGNADGNTRRIPIDRLVALIAALMGPSYPTRAQLFADLAWPSGAIGYVRADGNTAFNGVYKKTGSSGAGSWSRIGDLPSGAIEQAQLSALEAEMRTRRIASTANSNFANTTFPAGTTTVLFTQLAGLVTPPAGFAIWRSMETAPNPATAVHQQDATGAWWERVFQLSDLRNALRNAGVFSLTAIGGTPNAITASFADAALALGITVDGNTIVEVIPVADNTAGATLQLTGDVVRTMQTERGLALPAGFLRAGVSTLFRRAGGNWRAISSATYDQIMAERAAREAAGLAATALTTGLARSGSIIPLTSIGGTGDAWTAQLAAVFTSAGITTLSSDGTVEYIPALPNASANPTGTIGDTTFSIRNADGGAWPAFGFVVGRSYTLRRRGNVLRVIGDVSQPDLAAARTDRITGDAQMGSVMLEGIGGTGDAITASVPTTLTTIGISAANIREVLFTVPAANSTTGPTLNINSQGALQIRDYRDGLLPVGALVPGPLYRAVKVSGRWRIVTSEVDRAALLAAITAANATQQAAADAGDLRIMAEDRTVVFVGAPRATIDANPTATQANAINWVFPTPAAVAGEAGRFRAQVAVAGLVHLGVYREIGDNLVRRRFRAVFLPAGFVDVPVGLEMEAGEFPGAFMATGRVRFLSGAGTGYYFNGSTSEQTVIAKSSLNTTNLLLAQFVVYQGSSPTVADREALADDVATLKAEVESLKVGGRPIQRFGTTDDARLTDPAPGPANVGNYVIDSIRPAGPVTAVEFQARAAGTLRLKAGTMAGSTFNTRASVTLAVVAGFNRIETELEMLAGEMISYRASVPMVPFQTSSPLGTETGTWFNTSGTDLDSFTATLNPNQQHLLRFTQAIGASEDSGGVAGGELTEARVANTTYTRTGNDLAVTVTAVDTAGSEVTTSATFTIPATGANNRYDLIVYDHGTRALSRLVGNERNDAANIQPAVTIPGQQAVLRVRADTGGITSAIPIPEMSGAVPLAARAMVDRRIAEARRRCPRLMVKIERREPLKVMLLGDSLSALANGSTPQSSANGAGRDRITGPYLTNSGIYHPSAIAAIPLYTSVQLGMTDDGAGQVHSKIGFGWSFMAPLERRGWVLGTDLWHYNMGIPGTESTDLWDDATDSPKPWLLAVLTAAGGGKPDILLYAHDMNERPYVAGREARDTKIVSWIRAQGIEVLILTCGRAASGIDATRHTAERCARVARATGSGLIPFEAIWEDRVVGALGVNPEDFCIANRGPQANHFGTIEFARYGGLIEEFVP